MPFDKTTFPFLAALIATVAVAAPATAQRQGTPAQQAGNSRAAADLRTRIANTDARITAAERSGGITRARAVALHRQVAQTRATMTRLSRRESFVSAAELQSYQRTLAAIDTELDRRGVPRSYGDDMLPAAATPTHGYGNDALPSAEVTAFRRTDARLRYRNARIERDARGCAVYRGTAPNGRVLGEPLLGPDGRPICLRR